MSNLTSLRAVRLVITMLAIGACLTLIWITGRLGVSRLLVHYAMEAASETAASAAVRLNPGDAEALMVHGALLRASGALNESIAELERAVVSRPRDYAVWLELGKARDQANDTAGALAAFDQAVLFAPNYARPLWQRGNLHVRNRRYEEAFADLRAAAASNPELIPNLLDLAWSLSQQDVETTEELAQIRSPELQRLFARFLADRGKPQEALAQFKAAGPVSDEYRKELIAILLAGRNFKEAFQIWASAASLDQNQIVYDGGFEAPLSLDESGFGWRVRKELQGANLSFDVHQPQTGVRSLQIDLTGDSAPDLPLISQLLIVKPSRRYVVSFAARSKEVVTGGLPFARMIDATDQKLLGRSLALKQGSNDWQPVTFAFETGPATTAVLLSLQRENCTADPCPAFGTLWLDSFGVRPTN